MLCNFGEIDTSQHNAAVNNHNHLWFVDEIAHYCLLTGN